MLFRKIQTLFAAFVVLFTFPLLTSCGSETTTPTEFFGHEIGADYILLDYTQLVGYWQVLDEQSDRMTLVDIGETAMGQTMWMAIITSPENHRRLDRYKEISRQLALAEGLTDEEARELAMEGKAVV
jgi:hypothetical protein